MALADLLAEIDRQRGYDSGSGPEPVVDLELFFEGNDDLGSIGCNLVPHPGIDTFYRVLRAVRDRPEVHDVVVGISEVMGEDEWPFSSHVYVITDATVKDVARWTAELDPDEPGPGWLNNDPPLRPIAIPPNAQVITVWWD